MSEETSVVDVRHEPANHRFVALVAGHQAVLDYRRGDGVISLVHTGVPAAIGGRGVAAALVRAALDHARAEGLKVVPACSYVAAYFKRHPEDADLLA
jgi:predicted GNAT family acetyltransferase